MKHFQSWLLIVLCSASVIASAQTKDNKIGKKVEIKCHLELVGGVDIIHFSVVAEHDIANISQKLIGQKIPTATSKKQQVIYKVNECVGLHENFITGPAKARDLVTAR